MWGDSEEVLNLFISQLKQPATPEFVGRLDVRGIQKQPPRIPRRTATELPSP